MIAAISAACIYVCLRVFVGCWGPEIFSEISDGPQNLFYFSLGRSYFLLISFENSKLTV